MRLVVFAHVPPPHHGQAVMVQHLIEGLRQQSENGDIAFWHVNARMSDDIADVGGIRLIKLLRLFRYCAQAIWLRIRFGADTLYYVPAPAKKSAIVRDWMVMALVRPWFRRTVFHWHAFGLGHWATATPEFPAGKDGVPLPPPQVFPSLLEPLARRITRLLLGRADVSIVLTDYNRNDATLLAARHIAVVSNGIPDPCPNFETIVLPERRKRLAARVNALGANVLSANKAASLANRVIDVPQTFKHSIEKTLVFRVLFLAHCTREKGLFDTLEAVALANARLLSEFSPIRLCLTVAGSFMNDREQFEFQSRIAQSDLFDAVSHVGFVNGCDKLELLAECDCLCFPSFFKNEAQPVSIIESLACGLPAVLSLWRGLPDLLPPDGGSPVKINDPSSLAEALLWCVNAGAFDVLRDEFTRQFTLEQHLGSLRRTITAS